jgi:uncharacterized protein
MKTTGQRFVWVILENPDYGAMLLSIQKLEIKKIRFDETYPPGKLDWSESGIRQTTPLHAVGEAELLEETEGEVRVKGKVTVSAEADCDRCLGLAQFAIEASFDLFYKPNSSVEQADEIALNEGEAEIGFYRGAGIELEELLQEQVLLQLPMHKLCSEACRGICPVCGKNRNESGCECRETPGDERWSGLKLISDQLKKV